MRILALADIDATRWKWETGAADVVVSCGDVPPELMLEAAEAYNCGRILAVKGNHDSAAPFPERITDLHLRRANPKILIHGHQHVSKETEVEGTRVIGVCGHRIVDLTAENS